MTIPFWQETAPATTRREQRKQEFREKIMEASIQLFEKNGCDATTLEEICEQAEVSRPTFYSYYPSKNDLIKALAEKLWLNAATSFTSLFLAENQSTQDYIRSFFEMTKQQFSRYDGLERDLIRQSMAGDPSDKSNMNMLSGLTSMFETVYRAGQKRGDVSSHYDTDFLAEMSMGVISTTMMKWAVDENYPIDKRLKQLSDFIVDTLSI